MKKIVIYSIALSITVLFADEIDDMISKINSHRVSKISKKELTSINSPMPKVIIETNNTKEGNFTVAKVEDDFSLTAIMNNSANINGRWVKIGEKVGNFKLVDIMDDSIYLKDGNKTKIIFFKEKNNKIKITVGR